MSASIAPEPIRPPADSHLRAGAKIGLTGLALGLFGAAFFIIPDQQPANAVTKVFAEARVIVLTARLESGGWPADGDPTRVLDEPRTRRLRTLIAECPLPGGWRVEGSKAVGGPAIVFTPAATGQPYERCLRLVDKWLDDGDGATGELVIGPDRARLRLTAE
jgi:hypothetical protein